MKYLLVDDHPIVLNALKAELGDRNECLLARSLAEGLATVAQHHDIDLIIFDLSLPDSRGLQGLSRMRNAAQSIPILILSGTAERHEMQRALELGACGFVDKIDNVAILREAIELALAGGIYVPPEIVNALASNKETRLPESLQNLAIGLTAREEEILSFLALGLPNKLIADQLAISEHTVRVHVRHILKKMKVTNRAQVVAKLLFRVKQDAKPQSR